MIWQLELLKDTFQITDNTFKMEILDFNGDVGMFFTEEETTIIQSSKIGMDFIQDYIIKSTDFYLEYRTLASNLLSNIKEHYQKEIIHDEITCTDLLLSIRVHLEETTPKCSLLQENVEDFEPKYNCVDLANLFGSDEFSYSNN